MTGPAWPPASRRCARVMSSPRGCSIGWGATCGLGLKVLAGQGAAVDTTSAAGKLVFGIFAALAEFERELTIERTKAGLVSARGARQARWADLQDASEQAPLGTSGDGQAGGQRRRALACGWASTPKPSRIGTSRRPASCAKTGGSCSSAGGADAARTHCKHRPGAIASTERVKGDFGPSRQPNLVVSDSPRGCQCVFY